MQNTPAITTGLPQGALQAAAAEREERLQAEAAAMRWTGKGLVQLGWDNKGGAREAPTGGEAEADERPGTSLQKEIADAEARAEDALAEAELTRVEGLLGTGGEPPASAGPLHLVTDAARDKTRAARAATRGMAAAAPRPPPGKKSRRSKKR